MPKTGIRSYNTKTRGLRWLAYYHKDGKQVLKRGFRTSRQAERWRSDRDTPKNYRQNKHVLFGQQEGLCGGCKVMFPFRNFTVDHIVPQSRGGTDHLENPQLLCGACNSMKGDRDQAYLVARLQEMAVA